MATVVLQQPAAFHSSPEETFFRAWRPWMALYGVRLRPVGATPHKEVRLLARSRTGSRDGHLGLQAQAPCLELQVELAPIQRLLPEEVLLLVLGKLPIAALGAAQCVCRQWRAVGNSPCLWRRACLEAFYNSDLETNSRLVRTQYRCAC